MIRSKHQKAIIKIVSAPKVKSFDPEFFITQSREERRARKVKKNNLDQQGKRCNPHQPMSGAGDWKAENNAETKKKYIFFAFFAALR